MFFLYLLLVYLLCSFQCIYFINNICNTRQNNIFVKKILLLENRTKYRLSRKRIGELFDCIKCSSFVIATMIAFNNVSITATTAIIALLGNYFPFFCIKKNRSKNFLCVIIIGFFLDLITSTSMLFVYFISIHYKKHKSIATTSAMFVGIIKTIVHIAIMAKTNYIVATYFIIYGLFGINRNKRTFAYMYNYMIEQHKKKQENEKIKKIIELRCKYKGRNRNIKYSEKIDINAKKKTEKKIEMCKIKKQDMLEIADKIRNEYRNSNKAKKQINYSIITSAY